MNAQVHHASMADPATIWLATTHAHVAQDTQALTAKSVCDSQLQSFNFNCDLIADVQQNTFETQWVSYHLKPFLIFEMFRKSLTTRPMMGVTLNVTKKSLRQIPKSNICILKKFMWDEYHDWFSSSHSRSVNSQPIKVSNVLSISSLCYSWKILEPRQTEYRIGLIEMLKYDNYRQLASSALTRRLPRNFDTHLINFIVILILRLSFFQKSMNAQVHHASMADPATIWLATTHAHVAQDTQALTAKSVCDAQSQSFNFNCDLIADVQQNTFETQWVSYH